MSSIIWIIFFILLYYYFHARFGCNYRKKCTVSYSFFFFSSKHSYVCTSYPEHFLSPIRNAEIPALHSKMCKDSVSSHMRHSKTRHVVCDSLTTDEWHGQNMLSTSSNTPWFIHASLRGRSYYDTHTHTHTHTLSHHLPHVTRGATVTPIIDAHTDTQTHTDTRSNKRPYGLAGIIRMEMQRQCVSQSVGLLCQR